MTINKMVPGFEIMTFQAIISLLLELMDISEASLNLLHFAYLKEKKEKYQIHSWTWDKGNYETISRHFLWYDSEGFIREDVKNNPTVLIIEPDFKLCPCFRPSLEDDKSHMPT